MRSQHTPRYVTRKRLAVYAFFAVLIFLLYQMARLLAPFSGALMWAAVLALALHPPYLLVLRLLRDRAGLAASAMTLATLILVIGPSIALLVALAGQAVDLYGWVSEGIRSGAFGEEWDKLMAFVSNTLLAYPLLEGLDFKGALMDGVSRLSSSLASQVGSVLRDTVVLTLNLLLMLIALFFFFRNGKDYYEAVMELVPLTREQKQSVTRKIHGTFFAVINGVLLVSLYEGIITGVGLAIFGVPFAVLWGFVAFVLAVVPVLGAAGVWFPAALYLGFTGAPLKAVLLAIWGVVLVSVPDNIMKPMLIGRRAKLSTFFLLLGILGGLRVYGVLGILIGPLIVSLLTAFIQFYREEYAER